MPQRTHAFFSLPHNHLTLKSWLPIFITSCTHTHTHAHTHTHIHTNRQIHKHTQTGKYTNAHKQVNTHTHTQSHAEETTTRSSKWKANRNNKSKQSIPAAQRLFVLFGIIYREPGEPCSPLSLLLSALINCSAIGWSREMLWTFKVNHRKCCVSVSVFVH